jgi:two-component SAPR family response regulator
MMIKCYASNISSYEVASLSNVPSLSTAVLNDIINLSNLGLTATNSFSRNLQAIYFDPGSMPLMNGFELCEKVLLLDINVKVCFMTAGEINQKAIRELYPLRTIGGCFIKKPVERDHLIRQLIAELE